MVHTLGNRQGHTLVLLFSGGLDSYIVGKLIQPDIWLYLKHGNQYEQKELEAIQRLREVDPDLHVDYDTRVRLGDLESQSGYVPFRNLWFILSATNWGDRIALGATQGDSSRDKSEQFRRKTQGLLSYICKEPREPLDRVEVIYPGARFTKTALVREYLKTHPYDNLAHTVTCYHPTLWRCGECLACFKRWVAMTRNGIEEEFTVNPVDHVRKHARYKRIVVRDLIVSLPETMEAGLALWKYRRKIKRGKH